MDKVVQAVVFEVVVSIPARPRGRVDLHTWRRGDAASRLNPSPAEGARGPRCRHQSASRNVSIPARPRGRVDLGIFNDNPEETTSQSQPGRGGAWTALATVMNGHRCLNPSPAEGARGRCPLPARRGWGVSIPARPRGRVDEVLAPMRGQTKSQSQPGRGGAWTPDPLSANRAVERLNPSPAEGARGPTTSSGGGNYASQSQPGRGGAWTACVLSICHNTLYSVSFSNLHANRAELTRSWGRFENDDQQHSARQYLVQRVLGNKGGSSCQRTDRGAPVTTTRRASYAVLPISQP